MTYEDVSPLNERLIYADITGYGDFGPEADEPGYDITAYWTRSGLMEMTRDAGVTQLCRSPALEIMPLDLALFRNRHWTLSQREDGKGLPGHDIADC